MIFANQLSFDNLKNIRPAFLIYNSFDIFPDIFLVIKVILAETFFSEHISRI